MEHTGAPRTGGALEGTRTQPLVRLCGITKRYPGVIANDAIDLELHSREIHCLLGENGAGKTTLMRILAGLAKPDAGSLVFEGRPVLFRSPGEALAAGVGMVHQHPTLVPTFTVLENLLLVGGRRCAGEPWRDRGSRSRGLLGRGFRLPRKEAETAFGELAQRLGAPVDPHAVVGRLPLGQQQWVEILRALWTGPRLLILDEPTARLAPQEAAALLASLRSLKDGGTAVVLITHKLREALQVADRITVLRAGRVAGVIGPERLDAVRASGAEEPALLESEIVGLMFGERGVSAEELELAGAGRARSRSTTGRAPAPALPPTPVVLSVRDLTVAPRRQEVGLHSVSFSLRAGEIFGIAGVDGNGQKELAEALAGERPVRRGSIVLDGRDVTKAGVAARYELGLRFVTDDRLGQGLIPSLPVSLNLMLKRIGRPPWWSRTGRLSRTALLREAERLIQAFEIKTPNPEATAGALSGGNLQRLILARELADRPRVVVYLRPTQGLDARTALAVRRRIEEMAAQGVAAAVISTDLDELLSVCGRIGVLYRGHLLEVVENDGPGVEYKIGGLMVGAPMGGRLAAGADLDGDGASEELHNRERAANHELTSQPDEPTSQGDESTPRLG